MKKIKLILFIVLLLGLTIIISYSFASIPKNVVVIAINHSNFKTMDPHEVYESPTSAFVSNFYSGLVFVDYENDKYVIKPDVAEKWIVSADGKTWTFSLKKNLVFANGDKLTADDVIYSLQRAIKMKKSPSWLLTDVLGLSETSVSVIDSYTIKIVTNGAPTNIVLSNLGSSIGAIVNSKLVKEHEINGDMGNGWLIDNSAGSGPYVLEKWERNTQLLLASNSKYWKGEAKIKRIIVRDVREPAEQWLLLNKGDVDMAFDILPQQIIDPETSKLFTVIKTPGQSLEYVGMNAGWGPFKDIRVRKAVKYALEYDSIIKIVRAGLAEKVQHFIPVGYIGYEVNNPFNTDIAMAKKLMKEAGYENGFEVELITNSTETRKNTAEIVRENLSKIGIKANITIMQAAQMYDKMRQQGINLIVAGWGIDFPDTQNLASAFANHRVKQLAWRLMWYDDKAADMVESAGKEISDTKRAVIYKQLMKYFFENSPFAPLLQPVSTVAVSKSVIGADLMYRGAWIHFDMYQLSK